MKRLHSAKQVPRLCTYGIIQVPVNTVPILRVAEWNIATKWGEIHQMIQALGDNREAHTTLQSIQQPLRTSGQLHGETIINQIAEEIHQLRNLYMIVYPHAVQVAKALR
jgi:hypothetical protein